MWFLINLSSFVVGCFLFPPVSLDPWTSSESSSPRGKASANDRGKHPPTNSVAFVTRRWKVGVGQCWWPYSRTHIHACVYIIWIYILWYCEYMNIYIYVWHEHCLHFYFFAVYCILHQHLYNYKRDYASYCECFLRVHHDPCGPLALKIWTHNTLKPSKLPMAIAHPLSLVANLAWMIQSMRLLQVVLTYVLILCIIHVFYICLSLFIHLWMFRLKSPYAVGQSSLRCLNRVTWCPDAPLPRREGAPKHGTPCGGGEEMSGTRMEQLGVFMAN